MEPEIGHARALDILLNRENPRHEPKRNQQEIIEYLLKDEQVDALARHISVNGLNPLEIVAVFPDDEGNLIVAEGNRRICALQLLLDPAKAPVDQRSRFTKLAKNGNVPETLLVAKFDLYEQARPWLDVLHDGGQDGVGRRTWGAEQKARNSQKTNRHTLTLRLIDFALKRGLLAKEDKDQLDLTTMTRYLENPRVREAMGITTTPSNPDVRITLSDELFAAILVRFMEDADAGKIHSRSKSEHWRAYANEIEGEFGTRQNKVAERSLDEAQSPKQKDSTKPKKATLRRVSDNRIEPSSALVAELNRLNSAKLISIYRSLTTLPLTGHPALLTAGAWIFLESLTALHGRQSTASFESYIQGKLNSWNVDKGLKKEIGLSLRYVSDHGNAEKHSPTFTSADAKNLRVHFQILDATLVRLVSEC